MLVFPFELTKIGFFYEQTQWKTMLGAPWKLSKRKKVQILHEKWLISYNSDLFTCYYLYYFFSLFSIYFSLHTIFVVVVFETFYFFCLALLSSIYSTLFFSTVFMFDCVRNVPRFLKTNFAIWWREPSGNFYRIERFD